jgi:hypothetical protein
MVGPKQAYASFKVGCEALGFTSPERFAMDPTPAAQGEPPTEYQQYQQQMQQAAAQQGAPAVEVAKIKAQSEKDKTASQQQIEQMKTQSDQAIAQAQLQADQAKAQAQIEHAALSTHSDRQMQQQDQHNQMMQTLIKAFASILTSQLKQQPDADAGKALADDVKEADQSL